MLAFGGYCSNLHLLQMLAMRLVIMVLPIIYIDLRSLFAQGELANYSTKLDVFAGCNVPFLAVP